ncbi:hypothetical protein NEF87_001794 [Candidatus Lokiarchaeum ossiferum]|uniref:Histidine kinase N-terminal 7TM region domain-containing protein n=1 Tax=Candidatus Lokiarchaeum ossiferum TaxID=2951803 RepID=A0ABY6HSQ9_9ARCH|nr:hypothetical protein NEF87_001794 [Candidatus Lokiarchaeum sp. B-35]
MAQSSIAIIAGCLSSVATIITIFIFTLILQKYFTRKKKNTLYLACSVLCWDLAFLAATIIYFFSEINLEMVIWCQKIVYCGVFLGIMFSFQFSQEIFFSLKKNVIYFYWIIGVIIILFTLILNSVNVAEFMDGSGYPLLTISLAFSILVVIFILPTILGIIISSLKIASRTEVGEFSLGFRIIALGQSMILLTFVADTLASIFIAQINVYALLLYLTWIFPMIAIICYYLGWIMPNWFKKWLNVQEDENKNK